MSSLHIYVLTISLYHCIKTWYHDLSQCYILIIPLQTLHSIPEKKKREGEKSAFHIGANMAVQFSAHFTHLFLITNHDNWPYLIYCPILPTALYCQQPSQDVNYQYIIHVLLDSSISRSWTKCLRMLWISYWVHTRTLSCHKHAP